MEVVGIDGAGVGEGEGNAKEGSGPRTGPRKNLE